MTCATHTPRCSSSRGEPRLRQEQLGHSSISVTVDVYGHLVPGGNRAAVDRLDDGPDATTCNLYATGAPVGGKLGSRRSRKLLKKMVSREGLEPSTRRLRVCCSAS